MNRFFTPFIGPRYATVGVNGKKVLVVGASLYCSHTECLHFARCTNEVTKDSSSCNHLCPIYNTSPKDDYPLSNSPKYEIEDGGNVYVKFGRTMSSILFDGRLSWRELFDHIAFTEYVQFIIPHVVTEPKDLSPRDLEAYKEVVSMLDPDIVIVWGTVVNVPVKSLATERLSDYLSVWDRGHKKTIIVNPYHPAAPIFSSQKSYDEFADALNKAFKLL